MRATYLPEEGDYELFAQGTMLSAPDQELCLQVRPTGQHLPGGREFVEWKLMLFTGRELRKVGK